MNEDIKTVETDVLENSNPVKDTSTSSETPKVDANVTNEETTTVQDTNIVDNTYTIVVSGEEKNYLIESYKEMKTTNLYLNLILIAIVLMFVLSKFYYFAKSIFRVRF